MNFSWCFCLPGAGISVGCYDIYKYNIDCQWIDISEIDFGQYTFKVSINPEHKGLANDEYFTQETFNSFFVFSSFS